MKNVKRIGRLGLLAVGVGIGAAVAQTPIASADSSADWLSSIDSLAGGALPAAPSSGLDLAISFDGYSLFSEGSAVANTGAAGNGNFDFAIASGADTYASAQGGFGDYALADGTEADAYSGGGIGDYALADGDLAYAEAGGGTGANYDSAIDIGNNDPHTTGVSDGAYAGDADLVSSTSGDTGSYDTAIDIGNNTNDAATGVGGDDGAFAGAGGLFLNNVGNGDHDTAIDVGNNSGAFDSTLALAGNGNYVSQSGNNLGFDEGPVANYGNDNTVIADTSYNANYGNPFATSGNDNFVYVAGPEDSTASTNAGDSNIAYVLDPFGSTASYADAGYGGNSDLAAVVLTDGSATATAADNLYDVVTAAGNEAGTAASTSGGGFLAELLSLF
jgi:hypothetical protein